MQKLRANDYEVNFLEGWRDASQVVLIGPERPVFTPNVQIHREPLPELELDAFFREQRSELAGLDGFRLLEHGDKLLGGQKALYHAYSWELPNQPGIRLRQLQYATSHAGTLFTITCSALEQDWEQVEAGFEMTLAGFAWV
ncbi:MAG: DcrB-related protein [Thermoleophilia bacterium]|nr:DcrB-related protein [Thermoleophilia bacterium]